MMKAIVTTTINRVTKAIELFQRLEDWKLIVIGDIKTPNDYILENGIYVSPDEQEKYDRELSDCIGWNCIQRRNFGLLMAHEMGADCIAVVDDDNIPCPGWGQNVSLNKPIEVNYYETDLPVFDPVGATNEKKIWHRGYPLELVSHRSYSKVSKRTLVPDVQADFWNGDPDIDAVCRLEHAPECQFEEGAFPIMGNKMSPFNSQNTFLSRKVLSDYFLFPHIGRMDDIWASYYVQAKGFKVIYCKPSVYQQRNEHNIIEDMKKEYIGYENNMKLINDLNADPERIIWYLPHQAAKAFMLYRRHF